MSPDDLFNPRPDATDAPVEGYFAWRRVGRPDQPVRIWFGPPCDPDTGEEMDRGWRWQMLVNGEPVPTLEDERAHPYDPIWSDVWPQVSADPIPRSEYEYLLASIRHAQEHDANSPFARPSRKIDLMTATLPF